MRWWLFLLAGPLIWTVHFFGVYAAASAADVVDAADAPWARIAVGVFSGLCAAGCLVVLLAALAKLRAVSGDFERFMGSVAAFGAALALAAVLWQGLPALIGH